MRGAYEALIGRTPDVELCGTATSAEEALAHLEHGPCDLPVCDLLITDVSLPGMDGVDLTARILSTMPQLPVLVVSVDEEHRVRAQAAGAATFLSKEGLARTLIPTVRGILTGGARRAAGGDGQ